MPESKKVHKKEDLVIEPEEVLTVDELAEAKVRDDLIHSDPLYPVAPMTKDEKIVFGVIGAIVVGVTGALAWFGWKEEAKRQAEVEERQAEMRRKREERDLWIEEQRNSGKIIIETIDGEYIAIPAEEYAKASVRKKGR